MNILPQLEKDAISKGYKTRIFVTSFWTAFFTFVLCSVLLLPVYIVANSKLSEMEEWNKLNSKAVKEQADIINAPRLLNQKVLLVMQNIESIPVADKIIEVTNAPNYGVVIKRISYEKIKIIVSGSAPNRDSLLSFKKEVDKIDFVKSTFVPVGDFAKDKDLTFTMTINIRNE